MTEPTTIYPNCKTEIKLTESLALRAQDFTSRNDFRQSALKFKKQIAAEMSMYEIIFP